MVKRTISRQQLWIVTLIFFAPLTFGQSTKPTAIPQAEAQSTFEQGVNALKQGDLDTARTAFEKVLRLSPRHPEAHNLLGWILLKQGDADGSIAQYSKAIQLKPNFAEAHINLANALVQKHDLDGVTKPSGAGQVNVNAVEVDGRMRGFLRVNRNAGLVGIVHRDVTCRSI